MSDLRGLAGPRRHPRGGLLGLEQPGAYPWRTVAVGWRSRWPSPRSCCAGRWAATRSSSWPDQVTVLIEYTQRRHRVPVRQARCRRAGDDLRAQVLPVIIFLGALVGLLYYLRVIQWVVEIGGGADRLAPAHQQGRVALRGHGDLPRPIRGAADDPVLPQPTHALGALCRDDRRLCLRGRLDPGGLRPARRPASLPAGRHRDERARVALHGQDDLPRDREVGEQRGGSRRP